jgi:hypothetical protein
MSRVLSKRTNRRNVSSTWIAGKKIKSCVFFSYGIELSLIKLLYDSCEILEFQRRPNCDVKCSIYQGFDNSRRNVQASDHTRLPSHIYQVPATSHQNYQHP